MGRELFILRHGKSDWGTDAPDFERPLTARGVRNAQQIGTWLWQQDTIPETILSSPAARARRTAEETCLAMGRDAREIRYDPRLYPGGLEDLLEVLAEASGEARTLMVVGHNPGLEDLLSHLVGDDLEVPPDHKVLPTATVARLAMPEDWGELARGVAPLLSLTRPRGLPERFPYPMPDGRELRDRPSYYYSQSAVVPYRGSGEELEVLIVSSSSGRHWLVPKGIQDPGLTPQEAGAKEAWEEAGVIGEVGDRPLGEYTYRKWGGTCTVRVYPMRVTRVADPPAWEEHHRGREWVRPRDAARRLKHPELGALILEVLPGRVGSG